MLAGPSVVTLFLWCRPAAILWTVWAIVIDSVERVLRGRLRPHVSIEPLESSWHLVPFMADDNSSSAVSFVRSITRVLAPASHAEPTLVNLCARHAMRQPGLAPGIVAEATATLGDPTTDPRCRQKRISSTVAFADPIIRAIRLVRHKHQPPEAVAFKILSQVMAFPHAVVCCDGRPVSLCHV